MTKTFYLTRCAPVAIAAMAALGTTSASAQTAPQTPVIVLPDDPAPAADGNSAISSPVVADPEPIVIDIDEAPAPPTADPAPEPVAVRAAPPEPVRSTVADPPAPTRVVPAATDDAISSAAIATPVAAPSEPLTGTTEPVAVSNAELTDLPPLGDNSNTLLLVALLGTLAVGMAALGFAISRRRTKDIPVIERPVVRASGPEVTARTAAPFETTGRVGAFDEPARPSYRGDYEPAATARHIALPRRLPDSFAERDALLRRLIAAKPDRANPFRSPRARAKRARLIMQSIGESFESRKPRFDLSQYADVWPALRGWEPAAS